MEYPECFLCGIEHDPEVDCDDPRHRIYAYEIDDGDGYILWQWDDKDEEKKSIVQMTRKVAIQLAHQILEELGNNE